MEGELFRRLQEAVFHHSCLPEDRWPLFALPAGSQIRLSVFARHPQLERVSLILFTGESQWELDLEREGDRWSRQVQLPEEPGLVWYYFRLSAAGQTCCYGAGEQAGWGRLSHDKPPAFQITLYEPEFTTPAWLGQGVMYQIFPDRFAPGDAERVQAGLAYHEGLGRTMSLHPSWTEPVKWRARAGEAEYYPDDFYGGTLRAIIQRLPYLQSLGVSVIYLNPIFEADSNHRYNTADYLRVDPILGDEEDLRQLVQAAAKRGMRLILDGVFSHTGADSRYFDVHGRYGADGACQRPDSPYLPWYDFQSYPDSYRCWWGFPSLPEVREEDPAWRDFIVSGQDSVVRRWLRLGAAGWRLDVADELPDQVLELIRQAVKEEKPDSAIIGEVWEDPTNKTSYGRRRSYAWGRALDSVMNYPLRDALVEFALGQRSSHSLAGLLLTQRSNYPPPLYYSLMNLLSSHDIIRVRTALSTRLDPRGLSREQQAQFHISPAQEQRGWDLHRLLIAIQYSLPGCPSIYYGDEQGMQGFLDPFNRAPWRAGPYSMISDYSRLAALRQEYPALIGGAAAFYAPRPEIAAILRLTRGGEDVWGRPVPDQALVCLANPGGQPQSLILDLWQPGRGLDEAQLAHLKTANYRTARCLLTGAKAKINQGLLTLTLEPTTAYLLLLEA